MPRPAPGTTAVGASKGAEPPDRVRAFVEAFRSWAIGQPHRYLLLGSPLPGYHAPEDTIMAAHRTMSAFLSVLPTSGTPGLGPSTLDDRLLVWAESRGEGGSPPPCC
ncbi:TetR-like C-terminal domain-containing protein [Saccharothrix sp. HUAS TT1]|uniref:TetR-like C-terminal domain-containing protein n=1 Tax=unclassified Saccharothrix TaxID=2593673 RepID=UPI00345B9F56